MDKIKLELTAEEYKNLLKLVYLGEWVSQSYSEEPSEKVEGLTQKIYAAAKDIEKENMIEYDEKAKVYYPSVDMEEDMLEAIDEYDDFVFWDELVDRMAERDMLKEYGEKKIENMSVEDRIEMEQDFVEKYDEEFADNGIDNLIIKK